MIEKTINFIKKYNHATILLYYFIFLIWFNYLEKTIVPKYYMYSFLDPHIPFVKEFVVPYIFWFFYVAIGLAYFALKSRPDFIKLATFLFSGMTICLIIYMLFPNGQNLRPQIVDTDVFSNIIKKLYITDTPTNVAPSIHVFNSIAIHVAIVKSDLIKKKFFVKITSFLIMISICLSTVFIKQHSFRDITFGVLLAAILYWVVYKVDYTKISFAKKAEQTSEK